MTGSTSDGTGRRLRQIVLVADLAGTAVFAAEGTMIAVDARLDLLGILVIAFVTALGGGVLRDVLLQSGPPAALRDARYPLFVLAGAATALLCGSVMTGAGRHMLLVLDAAGLSLFAMPAATLHWHLPVPG